MGEASSGQIGGTGGEESVSLSQDNNGNHSHFIAATSGTIEEISDSNQAASQATIFETGYLGDTPLSNRQYRLHGTQAAADKGRSSAEGQGTPHNNMPPYVKLRACKKIANDVTVSTDFQLEINSIKASLDSVVLENTSMKAEIELLKVRNITLQSQIDSILLVDSTQNTKLSSLETADSSKSS